MWKTDEITVLWLSSLPVLCKHLGDSHGVCKHLSACWVAQEGKSDLLITGVSRSGHFPWVCLLIGSKEHVLQYSFPESAHSTDGDLWLLLSRPSCISWRQAPKFRPHRNVNLLGCRLRRWEHGQQSTLSHHPQEGSPWSAPSSLTWRVKACTQRLGNNYGIGYTGHFTNWAVQHCTGVRTQEAKRRQDWWPVCHSESWHIWCSKIGKVHSWLLLATPNRYFI